MTKMDSPVRQDSTPREDDLISKERESKNADDACLLISSSLKRKADGKCGSPTSSKDSHSDRDSDYEDSNSENPGMFFCNSKCLSVARMLVCGILILTCQNNLLLCT